MRCRCWSVPGTSAIRSGDRLDEAQTLRDLARAHLAADRADQASQYLRQAVGIFEDLGDETQAVAVRAEFPGLSA